MNERAHPTLLSRALAFPAAGFLSFTAGQVGATGADTRHLLDSIGIKLPLITRVVYGSLSPLLVGALLLAAIGVLVCSYRSPPASWPSGWPRRARLAAQAVTALAVSAACLVFVAYPLAFTETQIALQK